MPDHNPPSAPRIAISFGKSSSSSSSKPSRPPPPSRLGKRPRAPALGNDSDSDSDPSHHRRHGHGHHETITELGGDGDADGSSRKKARDLVITKQSNRDWKAELRAKRGGSGRNLLPAEARAAQAGGGGGAQETEPADAQKEIQWGLSHAKARQPKGGDDADDRGEERQGRSASPAAEAVKKPQTADEAALDALLGKKRASEERIIRPSEDNAYQEDVSKHVGADATMDDYEAIPDGEFGAALLRGMGWDGKMRGPRPSKAAAGERRQNQLGLGAKKLQDAEDLGQWNHGGAKRKDGRPPKLSDYRREEEKKKAERRERREGGHREERNRYQDVANDRERHRDREREYERDRESRRDRDRDRDRERDSGRHRSGESRRY